VFIVGELGAGHPLMAWGTGLELEGALVSQHLLDLVGNHRDLLWFVRFYPVRSVTGGDNRLNQNASYLRLTQPAILLYWLRASDQ
jgi:hypothetical protein